MALRKDHFSSYAASYAKFRPNYPEQLISTICEVVEHKIQALDVGTGNGQVAMQLAEHFQTVYGVDISPQQMAQSSRRANVHYMISNAESTPFADRSFDLIVAAQSYHWFGEEQFWQEMKRLAKPGAVAAIWGYQLLRVDHDVDELIDDLYYNTLGQKYWDPERKKIEDQYQSIHFPCDELPFPDAEILLNWTWEELLGYISTWSAVQKYIREKRQNPLKDLEHYLLEHWEEEATHEAHFPIFGRLGRIC